MTDRERDNLREHIPLRGLALLALGVVLLIVAWWLP